MRSIQVVHVFKFIVVIEEIYTRKIRSDGKNDIDVVSHTEDFALKMAHNYKFNSNCSNIN